MKKENKEIKRKVEKTLTAFDNAERAAPRPFFYSRLKSRMENRASERVFIPHFSLAMRRILAGIVILLLALNVFTLSQILNGNAANGNITENTTQAINNIYYPTTPTVYTIENNLTP